MAAAAVDTRHLTNFAFREPAPAEKYPKLVTLNPPAAVHVLPSSETRMVKVIVAKAVRAM